MSNAMVRPQHRIERQAQDLCETTRVETMRASITALIALGFTLLASAAYARPPEVERAIPTAQQVGEARYQILAWTLFDAGLWSPGGAFSWNDTFALTLTYRRSFSASALVNRTIDEMSRRGSGDAQRLGALQTELVACFADVQSGDRITGISSGQNTARFYFNGRERCEIEWPGFRRDFFGIWLDAAGRDRVLSNQLKDIS